MERWITPPSDPGKTVSHPVRPGGRPLSRATILVVDDNEVVLEVTRARLEDADFFVSVVTSPLKINPAIREFKPDLILLDVYMPVLSGRRTAEILKQYNISKGIPVLLFSGADALELEEIARDLELEGFVKKSPLNVGLVESVEKALGLDSLQDS